MRCKRGRWQACATALLAGAMASAGCSLTLSGPEPRVAGRPRTVAPQCDTGKGLVVLDGLTASVVGLGALTAAGSEEPQIAAVPALLAVALIAAAARGNSAVNDCRAAYEELRLEMISAAAPAPGPAGRKGKRKAPALAPPSATRATAPAPTRAASSGVAPAPPPPQRAAPPSPAPAAPRPATTTAPAAIPTAPMAPRPSPPPIPAPPRSTSPAPPPAPAQDEPWADFWTEVP